jgi:hypothetical protein
LTSFAPSTGVRGGIGVPVGGARVAGMALGVEGAGLVGVASAVRVVGGPDLPGRDGTVGVIPLGASCVTVLGTALGCTLVGVAVMQDIIDKVVSALKIIKSACLRMGISLIMRHEPSPRFTLLRYLSK